MYVRRTARMCQPSAVVVIPVQPRNSELSLRTWLLLVCLTGHQSPPHKVACMQDDKVDAPLLDMAVQLGHTVQQDEDGSPGDNEQAITVADCSAPPSVAGPVHITPPPTSRPIRPSFAVIGGLKASAAGSEPSPVVTAGASGSQLGFAPRSGAYTEPVGLGGGAASQPLTRTCSRDSIQSPEKNELEAENQVNPSCPIKM